MVNLVDMISKLDNFLVKGLMVIMVGYFIPLFKDRMVGLQVQRLQVVRHKVRGSS